MATQELRQRQRDGPTPSNIATTTTMKNKKAQRRAMAKRGLKSLAIAVSFPLFLTVVVLFFLGSSHSQPNKPARPIWRPANWALHSASAFCASLMGLAAWLAWAEGCFHRRSEALPLYFAQLVLGLSWAPLVFRMGSARAGLAVSVGLVAVMYGCSRCFRRVNPIAADLVKPCLVWALFLALISYKLI